MVAVRRLVPSSCNAWQSGGTLASDYPSEHRCNDPPDACTIVGMSELKKCPKCNTPMEEQAGCVVPMEVPGLGQKPISFQQGIAVMPFHCPQCRYVELYSTAPLVRSTTVDELSPARVGFQTKVQ
jgi:hypothetical protein